MQDCKRQSWCTEENIKTMYEDVYKEMVEAGVAIELDQEVMLDINGNIVEEEKEMFGCPTQYIITKPEQIIFVDKCGSNKNQKDDGYAGDERFILTNDGEGGVIGDTTDLHFTVMCFT